MLAQFLKHRSSVGCSKQHSNIFGDTTLSNVKPSNAFFTPIKGETAFFWDGY